MVETRLSPVAHNVPIADPQTGYITPYFQRMLQVWLKEKAAAEDAAITLENLGGDPGADRLILWDDSAGEFAFITASEALDIIGSTHGSILYRDDNASGGWKILAPGTSGQLLQTNGSGADPSWVTPSSGSHRGALVSNTAGLTGINAGSFIYIPWANEAYDTDNIHGISSTVTITIASPGVVTWTGHNFAADSPIVLSTTGALPTGLTAGTTYFVRNPAANTFQLATSTGGASINTSGSQSGVHTATNNSRLTVPSGVTKVRLGYCITATGITAGNDLYSGLRKNAADVTVGGIWLAADALTQGFRGTAHSAVLVVSPGDYFEVTWTTSGDTSSNIDALSWFEMEIIE